MKLPRWYRWTVVIVGAESGSVSPPMRFIRFRRFEQAQAWCHAMNANDPFDLTRWEPIAIE
jgi:hypothetical protein